MSDTAAFVIRSFSFPVHFPSALSILKILSSPLGFQRISEFLGADSGQGLLFHVGGYLCPVAFLTYIAFLIQLSKYNAAQGRRESLLMLNHLSFVCCRCRFTSASTSGGIRSTSLWIFCNSLSSFARSMRSFILSLSLALALASSF